MKGRNSVLGHGAIYVVGTVIQRGLALLLLPVVTRILSVEEYGLVGTATALAALLAIVYGFGLSFAVVRTYYDDPPESATAGWATLLRTQAVVAAVVAGLTYATGPLWSQLFADFGWSAAIQVAVLFGYVNALQGTAQGVLRAARRPMAFVAVSSTQVVIGAGVGIPLATTWGAAGYLAGMTAGSAVALLISVTLSYRAPRWDRTVVREGFGMGIPFLLHAFSTWGLTVSDRLIVAFYLGLAEVGRYNVAYTLASAMTLLLTSMQSAWSPHYLGEMDPKTRRQVPPRLVMPLTILAALAVGMLVLAAPLILHLAAPEAFHGTELIIAVVAASTVARAPYFASVVVLLEAKNTKVLATASLVGAAVNIGLNIALIPAFGLVAAAAATSIAFALQALLVMRRVEGELGATMHLDRLALAWAVAITVLVGLSQIPDTLTGTVFSIVLGAALAAAFWVTSSRLRQTLTEGERAPAPSPVPVVPFTPQST